MPPAFVVIACLDACMLRMLACMRIRYCGAMWCDVACYDVMGFNVMQCVYALHGCMLCNVM